MDKDKKQTAIRLFDSFNQFSKINWNHSPVESLKSSEVFTLFCIRNILNDKSKGAKVSEISSFLDVAPPTVTQLINGLEQKGYVERNINKEDRRAVQITLTEKSISAINEASDAYYKIFEGLVEYIGEDKSNQLADLLIMVFMYFKDIEYRISNGEIKFKELK